MTRAGRTILVVILELWLPLLVLLTLWFLSFTWSSPYFPPLADVARAVGTIVTDRFSSDIVPSLINMGVGFAIAATIGIALGIVMGLSSRLYGALAPLLEFLRAVPGIALLPLFVLLFGIDDSMRIAMIAFGAVWPVLLNVTDGVRGVDLGLREVARTYRISRRDRLFRIVLPAASPQMFTGLRLALSLAIILIVASEYVASTDGIGFIELLSARRYEIDTMWAALVVLALIGYAANLAFRLIERRILRWHRNLRGTDS